MATDTPIQLRRRLDHHRAEVHDPLTHLAPSTTGDVVDLLDRAEAALDADEVDRAVALLDEAAELLH